MGFTAALSLIGSGAMVPNVFSRSVDVAAETRVAQAEAAQVERAAERNGGSPGRFGSH